uniref:Uncharacterized protein n=1 Tax=Romanomermis culicivorax TaxID=13658 RepID=A0A915J9K0_ROMCU
MVMLHNNFCLVEVKKHALDNLKTIRKNVCEVIEILLVEKMLGVRYSVLESQKWLGVHTTQGIIKGDLLMSNKVAFVKTLTAALIISK